MFNSWLSKEKKMEGKKAKGLQHVPISLVKKKKKSSTVAKSKLSL